MTDALIVDAVRSPIGRRNGALAGVRARRARGAGAERPRRAGSTSTRARSRTSRWAASADRRAGARTSARMALLVAGWPETVCGTTVDRQCGSSMQTAFNAAAASRPGTSTSSSPRASSRCRASRWARTSAANGFEGFSPKLYERWQIVPQGISAEVIADEWDLSREALDAYSLESHRRAIAAIDEGALRERDRPGRGRRRRRRRARRRRRDAAARHVAREARRAAAGVHGGRRRHGGQLEPIVDGAAAMLVTSEDRCVAARPRAARAIRLVRARRRRPVPDAARQPEACERALARRASAGTTSP